MWPDRQAFVAKIDKFKFFSKHLAPISQSMGWDS
jgi:hypothetical protein